MKIIITAFLLMFSTTVMSQQAPGMNELQKPVYCSSFVDLVNFLKNDPYNEVPIWVAKDGQDESRYVLFINPRTGGWTLIQFGAVTGCVLGAGDGSQIMENKERI